MLTLMGMGRYESVYSLVNHACELTLQPIIIRCTEVIRIDEEDAREEPQRE